MFKSLLPWKHRKTKVMVPEQTMEDDQNLEDQSLVPCQTCGRTFLPLPLKKHAPICEKNATKKRKVFDSLKQRVEGTDLAQFHQKSYLKKPLESAPKPQKNQWEENHQKLVDAIRSAKGNMSSVKKATPPPSLNERCPFCERHFGPKAFDRHVEWCKEHRSRIQKSPANVLLAKERLEARTKYKVPPLTKSKRVTVKEKYSSPSLNRTESICSVKSTPVVAKRSPSVRKPKSVLDLGKKTELKVDKSSRKYCPGREKINTNHVENLESITVAPVKFKKLVTWKDMSEKSPDSESVIVVYENSNVFGKKEATKSHTFIEELKEILTDSDSDFSKKQSEEVTVSNTTIEECKSAPEFANSDEDLTKLINSHIDSELSFSDLAENFQNCFISDEDSKHDLRENSDNLGEKHDSPSNDSLFSSRSTEKNDAILTASGEKHDLLLSSRSTEKNDSVISISGEKLDYPSNDSLFSSRLTEKNDPTGVVSGEKHDSLLSWRSTEKNNSVLSSSGEKLDSPSDDSLLSSHSALGEKHDSLLPKNDSVLTAPNIFCFGKVQNFNEYEVPKKRRKLNSTFIVQVPTFPKKSGFLPKIVTDVEKPIKIAVEEKIKSPMKLPILGKRQKKVRKENVEVKRDTSDVFLSYRSPVSSQYDPFVSAERQFKELLDCDTIRPHTAVEKAKSPPKKSVKSAETSNNKKRQSVIDPPVCFQDSEDDFELLENILNEKTNFKLDLNKNDDCFDIFSNTVTVERKYSDDMSSIDSNLINENDNLSIPENFKLDNYSPTSTEDTDTTIQNDFFEKIETTKKTKTKTGCNEVAKTKSKCVSKAKTTKEAEKNKNVENNKNCDIKAEDLFAVDDKMYAEYKIYEEMYLKEKEQRSNKKSKAKHSVKSYGIELEKSKVSDDSAYGSLTRAKMDSENVRMSKFCHECGNKYPLTTAKFCVECGVKRLVL
ncbi:uncharacterized protein LOC657204 [Tribolium castaneum]|uniref:uncharacterized protein LOC657204 n=1 Tax=Tribolium castaneum TaxID=7070 RepID=UPI00077DC7DA|nr:PREDICTED: uncharacterized protein LOC657204 isoform X2 [Tribolium castaneum]|eukprot:XP_015837997.1 PREDICTED: uncharacterized protein LOC657204 isoform X2 [Tribolium castaneum]